MEMDKIDALFKAADDARAYIGVTSKMGPSEQLLAFIDRDGSLESEMGIEGFNAWSVNTRHEVLLSKLNPDKIDEMATEGFVEFLKKRRHWLLAGSFFLEFPFPFAIAGYILKSVENSSPCNAYSLFQDSLKNTQNLRAELDKVVSAIPSNDSKDRWAKVDEQSTDAVDNSKKINDSAEVSFKQSGWTVDKFESAVRDSHDEFEKIASLEKKLGSKLSAAESIASASGTDKDVLRAVQKATNSANRLFNETTSSLKTTLAIAKSVSKFFTAQK